jgi:hypothetical protein
MCEKQIPDLTLYQKSGEVFIFCQTYLFSDAAADIVNGAAAAVCQVRVIFCAQI